MRRVTLVGIGECGGRLVDSAIEILRKNKIRHNNIYEPFFIDCDKKTMNLKNWNKYNSLIVGNESSFSDRKKAIALLKNNVNFKSYIYHSFRNELNDTICLIASSSGGFGSGSILEIAREIRKINSTSAINLIIVLPDKKNITEIDIKNTLRLNYEIETTLKYEQIKDYCTNLYSDNQPTINSVMYVDNSKKKIRKTYDDYNIEVMNLVIKCYEIQKNNIDNAYVHEVNKALGYKILLQLSNNKNWIDAIEEEVNNSPFIFPDELYNRDIINYLSQSEKSLFSERLSFFTDDCFDKNNINVHNIIRSWYFSRTCNVKCNSNVILATGYMGDNKKLLPSIKFD